LQAEPCFRVSQFTAALLFLFPISGTTGNKSP
jgi:hypothetical protein